MLISCAVTVQLIRTFVLAYAKSRFLERGSLGDNLAYFSINTYVVGALAEKHWPLICAFICYFSTSQKIWLGLGPVFFNINVMLVP